jgi:putative addiction module component (TIGR02574 family)
MGAVGQHVAVCGSALGNRRYAGDVTDAAESLLEEALRLPAADRAQLASGLLASLDAETVDEAAVDEAWSEGTERRARTLADGSAELVTWEHLAERIDARRSPNAGG